MSASTSHTQPRLNGRLAPADPGLAELQDLNEDGTAMHLDLRRLCRLLDRFDREMDRIALERQKMHRYERRMNRLFDGIREELARLNEASLATHRQAGRLGCELQAARHRVHTQVVIQENHGRVEVRSGGQDLPGAAEGQL